MISTLIYNAKFGDKLAMEQLLHKFHPLLKNTLINLNTKMLLAN